MSLGLAYWILMLLWFVFGLWAHFYPGPYGLWGGSVLLFVLLLLLGWQVFGAPIRG